jgi:hypothetical protein
MSVLPSSAATRATPPTAAAPRPPRALWLLGAAALVCVILLLAGPIHQPEHYIHFADTRMWLGIPNAADVLSNLPFLAVGGWGLWQLHRARLGLDAARRAAWMGFALAITATAVGSSVFHWQPNVDSLTLDRLPIAWACTSLLCAFLAERVHAGWGRLWVLLVTGGVATAACLYWWWGERFSGGLGDLRPYIAVQLMPMLLVPLALLLRVQRVSEVTPTAPSAWWWALGLYAAAKATEAFDAHLLEAWGLLSGHTIKHLLAAAAAGVLLRAAIQVARTAPIKTDAQAAG